MKLIEIKMDKPLLVWKNEIGIGHILTMLVGVPVITLFINDTIHLLTKFFKYMRFKIPFDMYLKQSNDIESIILNLLLVLLFFCNCYLISNKIKGNIKNEKLWDKIVYGEIRLFLSFCACILFMMSSPNIDITNIKGFILMTILYTIVFFLLTILIYKCFIQFKTIWRDVINTIKQKPINMLWVVTLSITIFATSLILINIILVYQSNMTLNIVQGESERVIIEQNSQYIITAPYNCEDDINYKNCKIIPIYRKEKLENKDITTVKFYNVLIGK